MSTPDLTSAQIVATAKVLLAVSVSCGLSLTGHQQEAVVSAVTLLAPALALIFADVKLRGKRAAVLINREALEAQKAIYATQKAVSVQTLPAASARAVGPLQ